MFLSVAHLVFTCLQHTGTGLGEFKESKQVRGNQSEKSCVRGGVGKADS